MKSSRKIQGMLAYYHGVDLVLSYLKYAFTISDLCNQVAENIQTNTQTRVLNC
jgi:hypothetical protein